VGRACSFNGVSGDGRRKPNTKKLELRKKKTLETPTFRLALKSNRITNLNEGGTFSGRFLRYNNKRGLNFQEQSPADLFPTGALVSSRAEKKSVYFFVDLI